MIMERADVLPLLGEAFREHGYEGASLSVIYKRTGLGRGSLYHFFPGGKAEMAAAVLEHINAWFECEIFAPLRSETDAQAAIDAMWDAVSAYFRSGQRVCLVGAFALSDTRDRFAGAVNAYFARWIEALAHALRRLGHDAERANAIAEQVVAGIQGAITLTRARRDAGLFERVIAGLRAMTEK
ncbi:TetR family transcriptional regulator [Alcanivorax sp. N3-2A]|nr:TetR family transcriptional regulator [Alcanivorax sp. N3-2A]|tara:strand:+ start:4739 stop:5287 length:549 start_codon:yes stop_codon:yes gene_type:complete